jgi:hypothetical protein
MLFSSKKALLLNLLIVTNKGLDYILGDFSKPHLVTLPQLGTKMTEKIGKLHVV